MKLKEKMIENSFQKKTKLLVAVLEMRFLHEKWHIIQMMLQQFLSCFQKIDLPFFKLQRQCIKWKIKVWNAPCKQYYFTEMTQNFERAVNVNFCGKKLSCRVQVQGKPQQNSLVQDCFEKKNPLICYLPNSLFLGLQR